MFYSSSNGLGINVWLKRHLSLRMSCDLRFCLLNHSNFCITDCEMFYEMVVLCATEKVCIRLLALSKAVQTAGDFLFILNG